MDSQDDHKKSAPLFLPRKGGAGWDLNPEHKYYYFAVGLILVVPFIVVGLCFIL